MRTTTEFLHIQKMTIACHFGGIKEVSIVFLHGNSCSGTTFKKQLAGQLVKKHGLLAIDLPGHGLSSKPTSIHEYSLKSYACLVRDVFCSLGLTNIILVGWSLGGHIALQTSLLLKEIKGIFIYGTPPHSKPIDLTCSYLPNEAIVYLSRGELTTEQAKELAQSFLMVGSSNEDIESFAKDLVATSPLARPAIIEATLNEGLYEDEQDIVNNMKIPLAVLHGEEDQLVNRDYFTLLDMPTLWRKSVQDISGAGHAIHWEQPDAFNTLLEDFTTDCFRT